MTVSTVPSTECTQPSQQKGPLYPALPCPSFYPPPSDFFTDEDEGLSSFPDFLLCVLDKDSLWLLELAVEKHPQGASFPRSSGLRTQ